MNLKTFYYRVTDPNCTKSIKVDIQKCKTVSDLKSQIALDLHLSESDFQLKSNASNEKTLIEILSPSDFTVNILHRSYNIDFIFPDYSRIQIPNSYQMTLDELFRYFAQNQIYFSYTSKKSIQFTVSNQEVPNFKYPFLSIQVLTPVHIKLPSPAVSITYEGHKFLFSEKETISEAIKEIKRIFPTSCFIYLLDHSKSRIDFREKLHSNMKYLVSIGFQVPFKSVDDSLFFTKKIDSLLTVDEARTLVANEVSKIDSQVEPEEVYMFDCTLKMIRDTRKKLKTIQNLFKTFYFEVNKEAKQPKSRKTIFKFSRKGQNEGQIKGQNEVKLKNLRKEGQNNKNLLPLLSSSDSLLSSSSLSSSGDKVLFTIDLKKRKSAPKHDFENVKKKKKPKKAKKEKKETKKVANKKIELHENSTDSSTDDDDTKSDTNDKKLIYKFKKEDFSQLKRNKKKRGNLDDDIDDYNDIEISNSVSIDEAKGKNAILHHNSSNNSDSVSNQFLEEERKKKIRSTQRSHQQKSARGKPKSRNK